ncbi:hypothetical protein A2Z33_02900 [Candidatus Gottesmanbacteria bacterium RBG_16_52_11]|uniref:Glycosyltransferase RgtA/B/C/D-like domain-containing protein n=1 Tax=Candidatus Gottesmanbacteria bacterium RBG_16_52_11 TaxID=1798374 RepID=A0A1F5YMG6_9BACT|nr:MAG: hypothetical protein A2Z33_02900 [Candidatus Gottesmanbacteria bacterium RBG_16_52_11]
MKPGLTGLVILGVITVAAFLIRVADIGNLPPSLSWDEASIGYNAYSILTTGRDEHGKLLPLYAFAAYGDYKPPLPVYLTVPFVAVLGLNETAVRMPSVLSGTAAVVLTYFLCLELFRRVKIAGPSRKKGITATGSLPSLPEGQVAAVGLTAAAVLAVSPWHIQLSRAGWEANIATTLVIAGVCLLLIAARKPFLYTVSLLPFVLAIYTFNSARYAAPLIACAVLILSNKTWAKYRKSLAAGLVIAFVTLLPILPHLLSPQARLRFTEVNIFTDPAPVNRSNQLTGIDGNTVIARIIHNRRIGYIRSFLSHYLDHFEPDFLFIRGDGNPKFSLRDTGQLYLLEFPLLVAGIFLLWRMLPRTALILSAWLLLAIIPAATARETPHALRTEGTLPVWQIFIAFSVVTFTSRLRGWWRYGVIGALILAYLFSWSHFWHVYRNHYAYEYSGEWQYGYREAIRAAGKIGNAYDRIVITESIGRPYMYVLFYTRYGPAEFRAGRDDSFDTAGFYHVNGFGKYRFSDTVTEWQGDTLYIMPPKVVPTNARVLETVKLLSGEPVLVLFDII